MSRAVILWGIWVFSLTVLLELPAAFDATAAPVKTFMLSQVGQEDLALFIRLSKIERPAKALSRPRSPET